MICPYLPAIMADRTSSLEFNSSPTLKISQNLLISMKRFSLPLDIYFKKIWQTSSFNNIWSQRWSLKPPETVKNLSQLGNVISPVLPRSRSYQLLWTTFVHRCTDFKNSKKTDEMKWSRKKIYQTVMTCLCLIPVLKALKSIHRSEDNG